MTQDELREFMRSWRVRYCRDGWRPEKIIVDSEVYAAMETLLEEQDDRLGCDCAGERPMTWRRIPVVLHDEVAV